MYKILLSIILSIFLAGCGPHVENSKVKFPLGIQSKMSSSQVAVVLNKKLKDESKNRYHKIILQDSNELVVLSAGIPLGNEIFNGIDCDFFENKIYHIRLSAQTGNEVSEQFSSITSMIAFLKNAYGGIPDVSTLENAKYGKDIMNVTVASFSNDTINVDIYSRYTEGYFYLELNYFDVPLLAKKAEQADLLKQQQATGTKRNL